MKKNLFDVSVETGIGILAGKVVPENSSSPFWASAAREVFASLLLNLYRQNKRTNEDILKAITAPVEEIAEALKQDNAGYMFLADAKSMQAKNVVAVMVQAVKKYFREVEEC